MKWVDRYVERLFAKPAPFDCGWCSADGDHGRHDMCTGSAVRPHREGLRPAALTECACALRQHNRPARPSAPEETTSPAVADPWAVPNDAATNPYRQVPLPRETPEERRHKRERRRRVTAVKSVLPAVAILVALAVASRYDGGGSEPLTRGTPGGPATGERAVWRVDPDRPPQSQARSFTALVSRLGCGEVGDVLAPQVIENPISVVVIFSVVPGSTGRSGGCPMDAGVPYSVPLNTPLGGRTLFDGTCDLPPASTTPACATAQRWPLQG